MGIQYDQLVEVLELDAKKLGIRETPQQLTLIKQAIDEFLGEVLEEYWNKKRTISTQSSDLGAKLMIDYRKSWRTDSDYRLMDSNNKSVSSISTILLQKISEVSPKNRLSNYEESLRIQEKTSKYSLFWKCIYEFMYFTKISRFFEGAKQYNDFKQKLAERKKHLIGISEKTEGLTLKFEELITAISREQYSCNFSKDGDYFKKLAQLREKTREIGMTYIDEFWKSIKSDQEIEISTNEQLNEVIREFLKEKGLKDANINRILFFNAAKQKGTILRYMHMMEKLEFVGFSEKIHCDTVLNQTLGVFIPQANMLSRLSKIEIEAGYKNICNAYEIGIPIRNALKTMLTWDEEIHKIGIEIETRCRAKEISETLEKIFAKEKGSIFEDWKIKFIEENVENLRETIKTWIPDEKQDFDRQIEKIRSQLEYIKKENVKRLETSPKQTMHRSIQSSGSPFSKPKTHIRTKTWLGR